MKGRKFLPPLHEDDPTNFLPQPTHPDSAGIINPHSFRKLPGTRYALPSWLLSSSLCLSLSLSIAIHAASRPDYAQLQLKIINEAATFADVRQALTDRDAKRLSETMHSLHGLIGIQRPLRKLLNALWENEGQEQYPEVAWELFAQPPVRLALASALLNSISPREKEQYLHYLLEFKYDTDEFNRGQVSKSLGAYGRPEDIPYLEEMANSESAYVVDAAATALGLMQHQAALAALQRVLEKKHGTPFGDIMEKVLRRAYRVILKTPPQSPPVEPQP